MPIYRTPFSPACSFVVTRKFDLNGKSYHGGEALDTEGVPDSLLRKLWDQRRIEVSDLSPAINQNSKPAPSPEPKKPDAKKGGSKPAKAVKPAKGGNTKAKPVEPAGEPDVGGNEASGESPATIVPNFGKFEIWRDGDMVSGPYDTPEEASKALAGM